jgi:hypothetical protein
VLLLFMAFLPPSFIPLIVLPDTVQVAGSLDFIRVPMGGVFLRELNLSILGHLKCQQGHDLLTTLELPVLHGITLQY